MDQPLTYRKHRPEGIRQIDDPHTDLKYLDTYENSKDKLADRLKTISEESNKDIVCRICLSEDQNDPEDPLISPCQCSGTMKYIHLK